MEGSGFILIHRKLMNSFVFQSPYYLKLWMWCLMKASYKDRSIYVGTIQVDLKKGQFVWGRKEASNQLNKGLKASERKKESTWENYLKKLEKENMIVREPNNKFTVITVVNYEFYQSVEKVNSNLTATQQQNSPEVNSTSNNKKSEGNVDKTMFDDLPSFEINNKIVSNLTTDFSSSGQNLNTNKEVINKLNINNELSSSKTDINNKYKNAYEMYSVAYPTKPINPIIAQSIAEWINDFGGHEDIVSYAIEQAGANAASTPKYFETILKAWELSGIRTLNDAMKHTFQFEQKRNQEIQDKVNQQQMDIKQFEESQKPIPKVTMHNWLNPEDD
ncbi:hypothetical protein CI088_00115 [Enterococcus plantarum]|uniref:DnaB/C C-terminal domain-containing protein n=1 Tax=Enterococcus plantarum TaxID=1077675 RepID=A0A2W3ZEV5_9ENTE|nr:DnaD domain protein [Enterococcus plantarum]PZL78211.1 hypothetical protein CI088_00115 [Enterococcus plantarum]